MDAELRQRLLFRRQYLYGAQFEEFSDWTRVQLPNGSLLAVHPDLEVTQVQERTFHLVLLGYVLDPDVPKADNHSILSERCKKASNSQALIGSLDRLGGRYVLFIFTPYEQIVLNDAGGLRQVFYYRDSKGNLWLAPQPGLLS
ncbi:MAG TPA: hypothetical protein PK040_05230, partial [Anaerolineaceae bacterium]|nr:hypothetical protein [Anaerolineaceae bacterium]